MALAAASPFASFDITDKSQIYDISPVLAAAVYLDLNLLSRGITTRFDVPVEDTVYYWNQESLNARTATVGAISLTRSARPSWSPTGRRPASVSATRSSRTSRDRPRCSR
jgi:hypothetical protein